MGEGGTGGGSTEELRNLSPSLSTPLSVTARDSDHYDISKIHSYRGPGLGALDSHAPLLPGDTPAPSMPLLQPRAHVQPGPDLSGHIQAWQCHLQSLAGFRKRGWRGGQRAGGNRACKLKFLFLSQAERLGSLQPAGKQHGGKGCRKEGGKDKDCSVCGQKLQSYHGYHGSERREWTDLGQPLLPG